MYLTNAYLTTSDIIAVSLKPFFSQQVSQKGSTDQSRWLVEDRVASQSHIWPGSSPGKVDSPSSWQHEM